MYPCGMRPGGGGGTTSQSFAAGSMPATSNISLRLIRPPGPGLSSLPNWLRLLLVLLGRMTLPNGSGSVGLA
eukprot:12415551-Karenia_brevis.AAC.1